MSWPLALYWREPVAFALWKIVAWEPLGNPLANLRYFLVTATVSYAIPNFLMFSAIPHLGAGYTGIMFTLSPIVTRGGHRTGDPCTRGRRMSAAKGCEMGIARSS